MSPSSPTSLEQRCANTVRGLAIDAIQRANSGHPGLPLGMADVAWVLWSRFLKYDPSQPDWADRDRFVLSGGHGSAMLYALLHLAGVELTMEDIQQFRQLGSRTAGHPEYGEAPMIETTTGPLGQGLANGVGLALAERFLRTRFGAAVCDHRTWVMAGDGDLMEGVAFEAVSLAGHLRLGNLVLLYDDNHITIDGGTDLAFSEDVPARFAALGWHVQAIDGHDQGAIAQAMEAALEDPRPSIVCCRTVIGYGSPHKAGKNTAHGSPLGVEEVRLTKQALGLDPDEHFAAPADVVARFRQRDPQRLAQREDWEARLAASGQTAAWARWQDADPSAWLEQVEWPSYEAGASIATRKASGKAIAAIAAHMPTLLGGAADLAGSCQTHNPEGGDITATDFGQRNLNFGIREHGMAAICTGMALHGGVVPYCATFLVFHDYMRPAVRLAAMMGQRVVYIYTHDSVHLGEDGPTHQPVEQLMALRLIPGMVTIRPADAHEVSVAWQVALKRQGPTALVLTRQGLPVLDRGALAPAAELARGGYVLREPHGEPVAVLLATGSEVPLALQAQQELAAQGVPVRLVNLASWELFDAQDAAYRAQVLPAGIPRVSVEAGRTLGWERYVGFDGASVGIDRYGVSAPGGQAAAHLGMTVDAVVAAVRGVLGA